MARFSMRRRSRTRKNYGNAVIHVPTTIGGTIASNAMTLFFIAVPSILAGGNATTNIEAQDKDRTVNVGHHVGRINVDMSIRITTADGAIECCIFKLERQTVTPLIGVDNVPSASECSTQGLEQAVRLANPGRVYLTKRTAYSADNTRIINLKVSPSKYKVSKMKAGDHWCLLVFNRAAATITNDFQGRYKEYE